MDSVRDRKVRSNTRPGPRVHRRAETGTLNRMSSAVESRPHAGPGLGWLLLCLATLAALFAMHGTNNDHMLALPGPAGSMSMASTPSMSVPAAMTPSAMAFSVPRGYWNAPSATCHADSLREGTGTTAVFAAAGEHAMGHGDCFATLRADDTVAAAALIGVAPDLHNAAPATSSNNTSSQRAPPAPSLTRLCISRT